MKGNHGIRQVRADDWPAARALRLTALADPLAPIAFMETHTEAASRPDQFWKDRTARVCEGAPNRQFVAEASDDTWLGTATVIIEEPGTRDFTGAPVEHRQAQLVGVFVRKEHRGTTVASDLLGASLDWAWAQNGIRRVHLYVHRNNTRAEAFYHRLGFTHTRTTTEDHELHHHPTP